MQHDTGPASSTSASGDAPLGRASRGRSNRYDILLAVAIGCGVLALYVRTLLPHVGGTEDTPKFQYLGSVLGTAHSPGYPLYILVSFLFSKLPFGTLAYRINLMSACFGALAIACVVLSARRLGAHRVIAAAAAVTLATGRLFWENSVIAEVYTLNAALWAAALLFLLRWTDSGRDRDLYIAAAAVALGGGNHLTILGLIPGGLALLLLARRPWRWRPVIVCGLILAAGAAQYAFIWLRTRQHARFLESRATNLRELMDVMTARRYANIMFHFDLSTLMTERLPMLWHTAAGEMGYTAIAAALLGLLLLVRRRPATATFLVLSIAAVLVLTANVVADVGGFLLPVFLTLWLLAAVGVEGLRVAAARAGGPATASVTLALVLLLPIAQLRANYAASDRHDDRFASRYFQALFRALPPRAAVITEDYQPEQMIHYGIVSGDFPRDGAAPQSASTDAEEVTRLLADGVGVFAFPHAAEPLRSYGFRLTPFQLWGVTLREYAQKIRDGQLVAIGASGVELPRELARMLDGPALRASGAMPVLALVGVKGQTGFTARGIEDTIATLSLARGEAVAPGVSLPATVSVTATPETASITMNGREMISADNGVVIMVFDPDGRVRDRRRFEPEHGFTSELPMGPWPLVQVIGANTCVALGDNQWHDVTNAARTGVDARIDNRQPFGASMLFYLSAQAPLSPGLEGFYPGCQGAEPCPHIDAPVLRAETFRRASPEDLKSLTQRMQDDGVPVDKLSSSYDEVYRVEVSANDQGQYVAFWLNYGGGPAQVLARARTDVADPKRAAICPQSEDASTAR